MTRPDRPETLPETEISQAYRLLLDRAPSTEEVASMGRQHTELQSLRTALLGSDEFAKKYAKLREQSEARRRPALVHLHVPKTAGTTLARALAKEPELQPELVIHDDTLADLRKMPRHRRLGLRYVHGHLSMGAGEALGAPYRYLCVIRRPGPRIFSFYQFIRRSRKHPAHELLTEKDMSFGDYLEYSVETMAHRLELDNGQIRRLAGEFRRPSLGQETRLLKTALHHALSPTMLFGFVEHLDSLLQTLADEGYLSGTGIEALNTSPNSDLYDSSVDALSPDQKRIFDSYTAWDSYFYDVSRALLLPEIDTRSAET